MTDDSVTRALAAADAGYAETRAAMLRARLEAMATEWERTAVECDRLAAIQADLTDASNLRTAAAVNGRRAADLRELLGDTT